MLLNQTRDDIVNSWQQQSDLALEAGQTPLFALGARDGNLENLTALYAYEVCRSRHARGLPPLTLVGGAGPIWLLALLHVPMPAQRNAEPDIHGGNGDDGGIAYIGADPAMAVAAATMTDPASAANHRRRLMPPPGGLGLGFQEQICPTSLPAQPVRWSAFPLAVGPAEPAPAGPTGVEPNWSAAAALLLAAALILLAILL